GADPASRHARAVDDARRDQRRAGRDRAHAPDHGPVRPAAVREPLQRDQPRLRERRLVRDRRLAARSHRAREHATLLSVEALLAAVDELTPRLVELLQELIRLPTVNPPGDGYDAFCAAFRATFDELGYATELVRVPEERLEELAPLGGGRPRP